VQGKVELPAKSRHKFIAIIAIITIHPQIITQCGLWCQSDFFRQAKRLPHKMA
jgi:hypothetical protein